MSESPLEPVLLGFSSGLVCLVACGPVLLPWLTAEGAGWRGTAARLAQFLAGRLTGYLGFAAAVWGLGLVLPLPVRSSAPAKAVVLLALAITLLLHALPPRRPPAAPCLDARGRSWRAILARRLRPAGPAALGLLTGLNLCPPFVAAGVRAAQHASLPGALGFFLLFFTGTLVWFLPFAGVAALRRLTGVAPVARLTCALVAVYYGYLGTVTLGGVLVHAWHVRS
jgi:sulfite exporter TauE/SafE